MSVLVKLWFLLVLAAGCDQGRAVSGTDGAQIYQSACATCHGAEGKPTDQMKAQLNVRDLTSPELRARISAVLVEKQVRSGSQNKLMPAFAGALSDDQIKAVSAFVASPQFPKQ